MDRNWVLGWAEAASAGAAVAGGKGANLGLLDRYGFPVPAGGVLIADTYRAVLNESAVTHCIEALSAGADNEQGLAAVQAAIRGAALPTTALVQLDQFLRQTGLHRQKVAVRSSATAEDGVSASFAGIHRSFLHLQETAAVVEAVKGCYASLWTPAAVAYRRRIGLADDQVSCAVVICAMVGPSGPQPACSGVAFTCEPRTGRRDLIVIHAAAGLGEAVVSGSVNPIEVTVHADRGRFGVLDRRGDSASALTDEVALSIARLAQRSEWALGEGQQPQDLEWAYDGREVWLLQARPVTRVPHPTFPGVAGAPVLWSNANLKDAVTGVQSTFSWSNIAVGLRHVIFGVMEAIGYPVPPGMSVARQMLGRGYLDLTALQWAYFDALGVMPGDLNQGMGGHQPEISVPRRPLAGRVGMRRILARLRLLVVLMRTGRTFAADTRRVHELALDWQSRRLGASSRAELLKALYDLGDTLLEFGLRYQIASNLIGAWIAPLSEVLRRLSPARADAWLAALLTGGGGMTSAEHGYRLAELAEVARQDPAAAEWLASSDQPNEWRQLPGDSPFRAAMSRFLDDYGHRGVYELELANPRWREDPTYLLEQVRCLLTNSGHPASRQTASALRQAAEADVAARSRLLLPLVRWLAAGGRRSSAQREAGKSAIVAMLEPLRQLVLETGRRMVDAGLLQHPADVFALAYVEVESYLAGQWSGAGARNLVADRQNRMAVWAKATPPDVFVEEHGLMAVAGASLPPQTGGTAMKGVGAAAGRFVGPARIIRHPSEGFRLQPGEILVAPSTDPGWTPLFLRAGAIVMEIGGYLSHGAIVAREYGVPAVVNVRGILAAVTDGQMLTVDGDSGIVHLLAD